ncbi:MAG TPA: DUF445 family protein [Aliicoccus persicus]|uniref:DUF445 family protein n=1 Tax=Aliicoccus persicus TaxID=930138 RepID=A0A921DXU5_9STAP|nr:DUF445 family protein [Aliicoccus persicus]
METVMMILIMAIIGSLIGGLTNKLAITMLFKPYETKYLFGYPLPFTPGLIPRRREEASTKLGEIIMGHLLTPEVFVEKLNSENTRNFLLLFIDQQLETMEQEEWSTSYVLNRIHPTLNEKILHGLNDEIHKNVEKYGEDIYEKNIDELIPTESRLKLDQYVFETHEMILGKAREYIRSERGYHDIFTMIDEFIENRGRLASSLKVFFSKDSLTHRVQNEFLKLLNQEKMNNILQTFIMQEYDALRARDVASLISESDKEKMLSNVSTFLQQQIDIEEKLNIPIYKLNPELFKSFKEKGKYQLVENIIQYLGKNFEKILDKLQLAQLIKYQIDNFELSKIESLVMEVSSKELRMITMLGFLLGGIIGVVQGIIVSVF